MAKKYFMWVATHKWLASLMFTVPIIIIYIPIFQFADLSKWFTVPSFALALFAFSMHINTAAYRAINIDLLDRNNNCDPYPLLRTCERLLATERQPAARKIILIDYAAALRDIGEYGRAYDILRSIDIDAAPKLPPITKFIYFNNLEDICTLTDRYDEADEAYRSAQTVTALLTNKKQRAMAEKLQKSHEATSLYRRELYRESLEILEADSNVDSLYIAIERELLCAKIHIKLGETENAKSRLARVIEGGNRLYAAAEARRLSDELNVQAAATEEENEA